MRLNAEIRHGGRQQRYDQIPQMRCRKHISHDVAPRVGSCTDLGPGAQLAVAGYLDVARVTLEAAQMFYDIVNLTSTEAVWQNGDAVGAELID